MPEAARRLTLTITALCSLAPAARPAVAQDRPLVPDLGRFEGRLVHEAWTTEDGLPVNSVTALLQGHDGYLWVGTFDGLVRFDGARFTVFHSGIDPAIPSNRVVRLAEGHDGSLWIATEADFVRFRHGRFLHIAAGQGLTGDFIRMRADGQGRIWVTTSDGLGRMDGDRFVMVLPGGLGSRVTVVVERRDGSLWAGTDGAGLYRLIEGAEAPLRRALPVASLDSATVMDMVETPDRRLWIGTTTGVWTGTDAVEKVRSTSPITEAVGIVYSARTDEVFAYTGSGVFRMEDGFAVPIDDRPREAWAGRSIAVDSAGRPWYATGSEVGRDGTTVFTVNPGADPVQSPTMITSMLVDRERSVWIGTRTAGLHRLKPALITMLSEAEGIGHRNVYPVHQDRSGDAWVGTYGNGVSRVHADGRVTGYTSADGYPSTIRTLWSDRNDRLWVGAADGLYACALPEMACRRDESPAADVVPHALFQDSRARLWGGVSTGLLRLEDDRWVSPPGWPDVGRVRAFAETPDGALWVGTNGEGLVRYRDGAATRITAADDGLPLDVVRALYVDADGWLWIGTEGRGLARLDPSAWREGGDGDRRIVSIRAADGLFDEVIHNILEDDAGRLWMSTNRGIFWVARSELNAFAEGRVDVVRSTGYAEGAGMRNREANGGVQPAGMRDRSGRLWFPTQDGVAVFDPRDVTAGRAPPPVVVESVVAGDSATAPGDGALDFGVDQRDLRIDYTALSFLEPANIRFRYRLDPYDADWVDAGARRSAFYTQVPPGRYRFRVMASNDPGVWSGGEASVDFRLAPRFRETRGALLLGVLSVGLVVAAGYRRRVGSLRRRERELTRLVEARTSELRQHESQLEERNAQLAAQADLLAELHEARSRLFANLSHELRTPLTLILGPLRTLLAGRLGPLGADVQSQHDLMLRNGERLLGLINQILDLSSLQAGALVLKRSRADLVDCARATTAAFASLAEERDIDLRFTAEVPELACPFDREQLEKVLLNLLSNALKFTDAGGEVEVVVRGEGAWAEVAVRDTGVGIAPGELPHVFDRFYQADASSTRRFPGTGIGLALAKELVELHGGDIRAESTVGAGSTFTVRLPVAAPGAATDVGGGTAGGAEAGGTAPTERLERSISAVLPSDERPDVPDPTDEEPDEDRTTVLVVDDNEDVRTYVRSVLEGTYRVTEAEDGEVGLDAARRQLPDLIVADVMMPGLDGLALGRALKGDPMTDAIPLVLLTARAAPEDHVAGLEHGADAYLVKPFHPDILEARVANLLEQRRRLRERFRQGEAVPPATAPDPRVALDGRLRPLVEARLMDPDFGPRELAGDADLSYHQLYRRLRDELGITPSGFIRRVRAECAAELLRQRAGSVTEIAYSVGFESLSYFRRAFHERFDASPTRYLAALPSSSGAPD